jgi:amidase
VSGLAAQLAPLDATGQAETVRSGEVTPEELVAAAIERVQDLNPTLNAIVKPMFERAQAQAATAEGPFPGVPMVLKDLVAEVQGVRFTEGSRFLADNVSTYTSEIVHRFERAGLVIVGRSATPEFGMSPSLRGGLVRANQKPVGPQPLDERLERRLGRCGRSRYRPHRSRQRPRWIHPLPGQ